MIGVIDWVTRGVNDYATIRSSIFIHNQYKATLTGILTYSLQSYAYTALAMTSAMRAHTHTQFLAVFYETNALCWSYLWPQEGDYLQNKHLLVCNGQCQQCAIPMNLQSTDESVCSEPNYKSIQHNCFFSKSLQKWLLLIRLWSRDCTVIDAADEAKMTEKSATQIYQYFNDVLSHS